GYSGIVSPRSGQRIRQRSHTGCPSMTSPDHRLSSRDGPTLRPEQRPPSWGSLPPPTIGWTLCLPTCPRGLHIPVVLSEHLPSPSVLPHRCSHPRTARLPQQPSGSAHQ